MIVWNICLLSNLNRFITTHGINISISFFLHHLFFSFVKIQYINLGQPILHTVSTCLLKYPIFLQLRDTWFVTCRLPDPDTLLFSNFSSDEFPNMKYWMVGSSYPLVLYFICSGRGLFPCIKYEAKNISIKDDIKGVYVTHVSTIQIQPWVFLSSSNKHASLSDLNIPHNITYIVVLVGNL